LVLVERVGVGVAGSCCGGARFYDYFVEERICGVVAEKVVADLLHCEFLLDEG